MLYLCVVDVCIECLYVLFKLVEDVGVKVEMLVGINVVEVIIGYICCYNIIKVVIGWLLEKCW